MIPYSGTDFSSEDVLKMQQEAIERVREMQKIARERIERTNSGGQNENTALYMENSSNTANMQNNKNQMQSQNNFAPKRSTPRNSSNIGISETIENLAGIPKKALSSISSALESVGIDNDRLLIIIMILILLTDDSDKSLVLALFYLLF